MRGEMSGEAQNSGRKPHPAPSQRRTAAAALPALHLPKVPDLQDEARGIAPAPGSP
jgi:hypothetical protein